MALRKAQGPEKIFGPRAVLLPIFLKIIAKPLPELINF
jgi:hypothetical protein